MRTALVPLTLIFFLLPALAAAQNSPPVADAGESQTTFLGDTVLQVGSASDLDGDPIVSWQWEIYSAPVGSSAFLEYADGPALRFIPDLLGYYILSLVVSDGMDLSEPDYVLITVVENLPPVAVATADPTTGPYPLTVQFDGTGSYDPEGAELVYFWHFYDGGISYDPAPTHVFERPGTHKVTFGVEDDREQTDFDVIKIVVTYSHPPIADAGADQTIFVGEATVLEGSATDPDGDPIVSWAWTIESQPPGSNPYLSDPFRRDPAFQADEPGDYVLSLVASAGSDWSLPDTVTITAREVLPPVAVASADVTSGPAPLTVQFDGSQSYDPQGGELQYFWDFGDGSETATEESPIHTYLFAGTFGVDLTVVDSLGQTAADTLVITVGPPEPEIDVSPLALDLGGVGVGSSASLVVTVSNAGGLDADGNGADLEISAIGFGAGSSPDFSVTAAPTLPATLPPVASDPVGGTADVEVTFAPSQEGAAEATLEIASNDTDEPVVAVALGGNGVSVTPPPAEQIAAILEMFDAAVATGDLSGDGPNAKSAAGRQGALRNMLRASGDLIQEGLVAEACQQLLDAVNRMDGEFPPPDFVAGEAAGDIAAMIHNLRGSLGCDGG